jgi:hypothetical protein
MKKNKLLLIMTLNALIFSFASCGNKTSSSTPEISSPIEETSSANVITNTNTSENVNALVLSLNNTKKIIKDTIANDDYICFTGHLNASTSGNYVESEDIYPFDEKSGDYVTNASKTSSNYYETKIDDQAIIKGKMDNQYYTNLGVILNNDDEVKDYSSLKNNTSIYYGKNELENTKDGVKTTSTRELSYQEATGLVYHYEETNKDDEDKVISSSDEMIQNYDYYLGNIYSFINSDEDITLNDLVSLISPYIPDDNKLINIAVSYFNGKIDIKEMLEQIKEEEKDDQISSAITAIEENEEMLNSLLSFLSTIDYSSFYKINKTTTDNVEEYNLSLNYATIKKVLKLSIAEIEVLVKASDNIDAATKNNITAFVDSLLSKMDTYLPGNIIFKAKVTFTDEILNALEVNSTITNLTTKSTKVIDGELNALVKNESKYTSLISNVNIDFSIVDDLTFEEITTK